MDMTLLLAPILSGKMQSFAEANTFNVELSRPADLWIGKIEAHHLELLRRYRKNLLAHNGSECKMPVMHAWPLGAVSRQPRGEQ